jgi:hypothetical protein
MPLNVREYGTCNIEREKHYRQFPSNRTYVYFWQGIPESMLSVQLYCFYIISKSIRKLNHFYHQGSNYT